MAYSHVAHDCRVGNRTIFLHGATLGGHVTVGDCATVGAMSGVHQFCRIGRFAFIGGGSMITQDVLPFCRVVGQRPTRVLGLNVIGLRRNGFSNERIAALKDIFKIFFFSDLNTAQALERIQAEFPPGEDRDEILRFIRVLEAGHRQEDGGPMGTRIGIIAGSGRFPLQALEAAKSLGYACVVAGDPGEAMPELKIAADAFEWIGLGRARKARRLLQEPGHPGDRSSSAKSSPGPSFDKDGHR